MLNPTASLGWQLTHFGGPCVRIQRLPGDYKVDEGNFLQDPPLTDIGRPKKCRLAQFEAKLTTYLSTQLITGEMKLYVLDQIVSLPMTLSDLHQSFQQLWRAIPFAHVANHSLIDYGNYGGWRHALPVSIDGRHEPRRGRRRRDDWPKRFRLATTQTTPVFVCRRSQRRASKAKRSLRILMWADIPAAQKPNESVARGLRRLFSPATVSHVCKRGGGGNFTPVERTKLTIRSRRRYQ